MPSIILSGRKSRPPYSYLGPILTAAWFGNRRLGIGIALLSTLAWAVSDVSSGRHYSSQWILFWNAGVRLGTFLTLSHLASQLRAKLVAEEQDADTDVLTATCNRRAFVEKIQDEIARCRRFHHPLTLAYIDLDNFKMVNDSQGHLAGDNLLRTVADVMRATTRQVDVISRLGGDEYAILLAETDYDNAGQAMAKVRQALLAEMTSLAVPVTFSIGMITYRVPPLDVNEIISCADHLMYEVKKSGKNAIKHIYGPERGEGVVREER